MVQEAEKYKTEDDEARRKVRPRLCCLCCAVYHAHVQSDWLQRWHEVRVR